DKLVFKHYALLDEKVAFVSRDLWITFHQPLKDSAPAPRELAGPEVLTEAYVMRESKSYVGSAEFRAAVDVAIDRSVALKFGLGDLLDSWVPAKKLLADGLSPRSTRKISYDPAEAKRSLAAAAARYPAPSGALEIIYDDTASGQGGLAKQLRE